MPLELILELDDTLRILSIDEKVPEGYSQIAIPYINTQYVRDGLKLIPVELLNPNIKHPNFFIFPEHIKVYVEY